MITKEVPKKIRNVSEQEIAIALVLELAESGFTCFSLLCFYDQDQEFILNLAKRLDVKLNSALLNKVRRVVRRLVK